MPNVKCIKRQYGLFSPLFDFAENQVVNILSQGKELQVTYSRFVPKRKFLFDEDIKQRFFSKHIPLFWLIMQPI